MTYTLVFENQEEGRGTSYDLLFIPCPVWTQGEDWILNLNPETPELKSKSVIRLIEKENMKKIKKCILISHQSGQEDKRNLKLLENDLLELGIRYETMSFDDFK